MTGAQHYAKGQTLLAAAWKRSNADDTVFLHTPESRAFLVASAHAHFAAAQAAAIVEQTAQQSVNGMPESWARVLRDERERVAS
jgi:hypothetical protein